jgi:DNA-binding transcriptional regulator YdaS (Cro superfamily)
MVATQIFLVYASFSSTISRMDTNRTNEALSRAIAKWPSLKAFATELEVPYQTVQQWLKNGVPAVYCPRIEKMTEGDSLCEDLNPAIDWTYLRGTSAAVLIQNKGEDRAQ